jgi:hypothetical protein
MLNPNTFLHPSGVVPFRVQSVPVIHGGLFEGQEIVGVLLSVLLRVECFNALWGDPHTTPPLI